MTSFAEWLEQNSKSDPQTSNDIRELAKEFPDEWPARKDELAPYVVFLNNKSSPENRERLIRTLASDYETWRASNQGFFRSHLGTIMLSIAGLIIGGALLFGVFFNSSFLASLSQPANARGLITFLFALGTIALILIIAIAIFWVDNAEVENRFGMAKDVLTILIGILGTILGFYFGKQEAVTPTSPTSIAAPSQTSPPTVTPKP
jgi:hypothetical protein